MNNAKQDKFMPTLSRGLTGVAGEYFVAGELSRRGCLASITLRNSKGVDIICTNSDATKSVAIQVKTSRGSSRSWILSQKAESYYSENLFYIFVNLHEISDAPDYFIVPSSVVADHIQNSHAEWLTQLNKKGQPRKDSSMRKYSDPTGEYLNRWDLLGL